MKMQFIAAFMAVAGPASAIAAPAPVTIDLMPQASVRGAQVRLAQVAHITTTDLPLLRRLMDVPLGSTPRVGDTALLERETLMRWLRSQVGLKPEQVAWTGAGAVAVSAGSRDLAGHEVVQAAQEALQSWLASRSERALVQALSVPRDLQLPEGEPSLRVRPLDDSQPRKRMLVWVDVWAGDRFVRALPVNFEVAAYAFAPVAISGVPAGAPLDASSVASREVDVTLLAAPALPGAAALPAGQRLRRAVQPGEVLTARHVETAPAVSRGDWATARSVVGSVALESRVEILQDGRLGQIVRVKQANASSSITARVTGQGQVEVQQ